MKTNEGMTRRRFIHQTTNAAVAASFLTATAPIIAAAAPKPWLITCRDVHLDAVETANCWTAIKSLGLQGVEAAVNIDLSCPGLIHPDRQYRLDTDANIKALKDDLAANGVVISAFCMANQFELRLAQELEWTKRLVPAAQQLGVKAIRIDVVPRKMKRDEFLPFAIGACKQLCQIAEGTDVRFGIENHGNTTNDPEFLSALFDGVGSPRLGQTLDVANLYWFGHPLPDLYQIYERFAKRVVHTHCKNIRFPEDKRNVRRPIGWEYDRYNCPLYEGDIDFTRLIKILRQANYQGDLCIEDESLHKFPATQRAGILKKEAEFLRKLI
jgi:sugar phosphate isomerase/epimerase